MDMQFYIERWTKMGWVRLAGNKSLDIAENLKKHFAKQYHEDIDNFSIVVEMC